MLKELFTSNAKGNKKKGSWGELWVIVNLGEQGRTWLGEPSGATDVASPLVTE